MVLHIGVDGAETETYSELLYAHFKSKKYKVRLCRRPDHRPVHEIKKYYNLLNHELALLHSFDECLTYYMQDWSEFDVVIWDKTILTDYLNLTSPAVSIYWINQINKFLPKKDYYIYIKQSKKYVSLEALDNIKPLLILNEETDLQDNFNNVINELNKEFPQCQWCNHIYKKDKHHIRYCSKTCSQLANQKQTRDRVNKYNRKYRNVKSPHEKNALGSNALLKEHPASDFKTEHKRILNEKYRLKL